MGGRLIHTVLEHIQRVRQRPTVGSDPEELKTLEHAARSSWGNSFAALHAPLAELTWEARTVLLGASDQTERVYVDFPGSFNTEIVGFYATLSPKPGAAAGLIVPKLDDIDVRLDINQQHHLTSTPKGLAFTPANTARDTTYVSLTSIHVNAPRLIGLQIEGANPQVGFAFRWKWPPTPGASAFYTDTMISMSCFVRHLREKNEVYR
jgi:hypothetical protein